MSPHKKVSLRVINLYVSNKYSDFNNFLITSNESAPNFNLINDLSLKVNRDARVAVESFAYFIINRFSVLIHLSMKMHVDIYHRDF